MTVAGALVFAALLAALFVAARAFVNDVLLKPDEYDPFDDDNC